MSLDSLKIRVEKAAAKVERTKGRRVEVENQLALLHADLKTFGVKTTKEAEAKCKQLEDTINESTSNIEQILLQVEEAIGG